MKKKEVRFFFLFRQQRGVVGGWKKKARPMGALQSKEEKNDPIRRSLAPSPARSKRLPLVAKSSAGTFPVVSGGKKAEGNAISRPCRIGHELLSLSLSFSAKGR